MHWATFIALLFMILHAIHCSEENEKVEDALKKVQVLLKNGQKLAKVLSNLRSELQKLNKIRAQKAEIKTNEMTTQAATALKSGPSNKSKPSKTDEVTPSETPAAKEKIKSKSSEKEETPAPIIKQEPLKHFRSPYAPGGIVNRAVKTEKLSCKKRLCTDSAVQRNLDSKGAIIIPRSTQGISGIGCGNRQFLFSLAKFSIQESASFCCSVGMREVSFLSYQDALCIQALYYNITGRTKDVDLHVDYLDRNLDFTYTPCNKNARLESSMWQGGEPNNVQGMEACVHANFSPNSNRGVLRDITCIFGKVLIAMCEFELANGNSAGKT